MDKLAEDIWKTIWFSLAVTTVIIVFMRYFSNDRWWEVNSFSKSDSREYENLNSPLIYFAIKDSANDSVANAELFIKNTPQEEYFGNNGVFENILPGQIASIRISSNGRTVRSPAFRLQDREIRLLVFDQTADGLEYLGSRSRLRRVPVPALAVFDQDREENLFQMDIVREIENYKPLEEASAKEQDKKEGAPPGSIKEKQIPSDREENIFYLNKNFLLSLELYSQFSRGHKSICE